MKMTDKMSNFSALNYVKGYAPYFTDMTVLLL